AGAQILRRNSSPCVAPRRLRSNALIAAATAILILLALTVGVADAQGGLVLWPRLITEKVRPNDSPVGVGAVARVLIARGEGFANQIVLTNTGNTTLVGLTPHLTALRDSNGRVLDADSRLYRAGYITVTEPSDPAGFTGEWPDALYPIGPDRYYHEQRNGAPFDLRAGRNQPIILDLRVSSDAVAGVYFGNFNVTQNDVIVGQLPVEVTIRNFVIPPVAKLRSTYRLGTWGIYCTHYYPNGGCQWNNEQIVALTRLYIAEAAAHRMTLSAAITPVVYTYDDASGTVSISNWPAWDEPLRQPGITSYPLPAPINFEWNNPQHVWTARDEREEIAFWRAVAQHYRVNGWIEHSFFYAYDEPGWPKDGTVEQQKQLVAEQANVLAKADPAFRALVTSSYDPCRRKKHW